MWTDCCCTVIAAVFALTLFIIASFSFNRRTPLPIQTITTRSTTQYRAQDNFASSTYPHSHSSSSPTPTTSPLNVTV